MSNNQIFIFMIIYEEKTQSHVFIILNNKYNYFSVQELFSIAILCLKNSIKKDIKNFTCEIWLVLNILLVLKTSVKLLEKNTL